MVAPRFVLTALLRSRYGSDPAGISPILLGNQFETSLPKLAMWAFGVNLKEENLLYLHSAGEQAAAAWLEKQADLGCRDYDKVLPPPPKKKIEAKRILPPSHSTTTILVDPPIF